MSEVQLALKHSDRANHKYVMKIGNRYFYSMDEVKEFKKETQLQRFRLNTSQRTNRKKSLVK